MTLVIRSRNSYRKYRDGCLIGNCGPGYRLGEEISPEEMCSSHEAGSLQVLCAQLAEQGILEDNMSLEGKFRCV